LIWWRVPGRHRGEIVSSVDVISANVSERALACRAQSAGIQEISAAAVQVDQRTQKNVELFHGTTFPGQKLAARGAKTVGGHCLFCFAARRACCLWRARIPRGLSTTSRQAPDGRRPPAFSGTGLSGETGWQSALKRGRCPRPAGSPEVFLPRRRGSLRRGERKITAIALIRQVSRLQYCNNKNGAIPVFVLRRAVGAGNVVINII
jgi:hypothetical protein